MTRTAKQPEPTRRETILAGPWVNRPDVYGQSCQLCKLPIFSRFDAYLREGDELSPALYRHKQCHEDSTRFRDDRG